MPRFMLGTDTVSYALRGRGQVAARVLAHTPSELCISAITLAELRYGAEMRQSRKLHELVDTFASSVAVLPFHDDAAKAFGTVSRRLARAGTPIGGFDALIAAHALASGCILVTHNTRHFARVAGLKTEDWA